MDKVVVDSSVVIKWFVSEPHSADARRILDEYAVGALSLVAPDLIQAEVGNILWKKQMFQGLTNADAQLILTAFQQVNLGLTSSQILLNEAYRLAITYRRTVYDALYLALSLREQCAVVTADEKLFNAIQPAFPQLTWIGNWP